MAKHRFKTGNKHAPGGRREGAGCKPEWFKAKCREICGSKKAMQFMTDVVEGKAIEEKTLFSDGTETIAHVTPNAATRIKAWESLRDTGHGRPDVTTHITGTVGVNLVDIIKQARGERGLPIVGNGRSQNGNQTNGKRNGRR